MFLVEEEEEKSYCHYLQKRLYETKWSKNSKYKQKNKDIYMNAYFLYFIQY